MKATILFLLVSVLSSCSQQNSSSVLKQALASRNQTISRVMDSLDQYEVQIRYTQIDRRNNSIVFTDFDFQLDQGHCFYPVCTVKFPIAVLVLERLNQTDSINKNTKNYIEGDSIEFSIAQDISEVFAVSDNLANNRMLELLAQDAINKSLTDKGIGPVRISHRLGHHSIDLKTKPLILYLNDSTTGISVPSINTTAKLLQLKRVKKGIGYYENDAHVNDPFDFSLKNYYPITSQHEVLKRVIFPNEFDPTKRFDLSEDQHTFLLKSMYTLPRNAGYNSTEYYDGYCEFFFYRDTQETVPDHIKIYNKAGFAYGTLTACAYIIDSKNHVDFLLTAIILANKNRVFNDNVYGYDGIGIPFLASLRKGNTYIRNRA
ncbi:serine hydrolase [Maribacter antarcticus]|uniref:serine hydrolase n=1 Tax=Maribacter antarcticus TaxID=505250 RepID=UPI0012EB7CB9|nr:serine hydrolase [Maribacter antarcticus]